MPLPKLSDVEPYLLTTIGAVAIDNLIARGYLEKEETPAPTPAPRVGTPKRVVAWPRKRAGKRIA